MSRRPGLDYRSGRRGIGGSLGGSLGDFLATSISGCVLWLRADLGITKDGSDRVSAWADQSGTGDANKNVTQGVAGNQPLWNASDANLGGRPSLTFARARKDQLDSGVLAVAIPTGCTWFLVTYNASYDTNNNSWISPLASGIGGQICYINSGGPGAVGAYAGAVLAGGSMGAAPRAIVSAHVFSTTVGKVFGNARTALASGSTGAQTQPSFQVGEINAGSEPQGSVAEVIAYNRVLSQGEVETVLTALGNRYAIAIGA